MKHVFDSFAVEFVKSDWHPDMNKGAGQKGWVHDKEYSAGVHTDVSSGGVSHAGSHVRSAKETYSPGVKTMHEGKAKEIHARKLSDQKKMPKPKLPG